MRSKEEILAMKQKNYELMRGDAAMDSESSFIVSEEARETIKNLYYNAKMLAEQNRTSAKHRLQGMEIVLEALDLMHIVEK